LTTLLSGGLLIILLRQARFMRPPSQLHNRGAALHGAGCSPAPPSSCHAPYLHDSSHAASHPRGLEVQGRAARGEMRVAATDV